MNTHSHTHMHCNSYFYFGNLLFSLILLWKYFKANEYGAKSYFPVARQYFIASMFHNLSSNDGPSEEMDKSFLSKASIKLDRINKINHLKQSANFPMSRNNLRSIYAWKYSPELWIIRMGIHCILIWNCPHSCHTSGSVIMEVLGG